MRRVQQSSAHGPTGRWLWLTDLAWCVLVWSGMC
jgi:hypothetical protein